MSACRLVKGQKAIVLKETTHPLYYGGRGGIASFL